MANSAKADFSQFPGQARSIVSELKEIVALRRRLAESEIRGDVSSAKRLLLFGGLGAVTILIGAALLIVALVANLEVATNDERTVFPFQWRSFLICGGLLAGGALLLWNGWKRFRGEFTGLEESRAELREDLVWLREWLDGQSAEAESDADSRVA